MSLNVPRTRDTVLCNNCSAVFSSPFRTIFDIEDIRANHIPSASQLSIIPKLLSEAEDDMARYDMELIRLHQITTELEQERAELQRYIERNRCLQAPIRRVPSEILFEIFSRPHEEDLHLHTSNPKGLAPLNISYVCTRWRDIVLSSKTFWTSISIDVDQLDDQETHRGGLPLSVTVETTGGYLDDNPILELLVSCSDRWEKAILKLDEERYRKDAILGPLHGRLPNLQKLEIIWPQWYLATLPPGIFDLCPRLTKLTLSEPLLPNVIWEKLLVLEARGGFIEEDSSNGLEILPLCTQLVELLIREYISAEPIPIRVVNVASNLHTMDINIEPWYSSSNGENAMSNFFDSLTLPCLKQLSITLFASERWRYSTYEDTVDPGIWPQTAFTAFIARSSCPLETLVLNNATITTDQLLSVLEMVPTLTTMKIADEPKNPIITDSFLQSLTCHSPPSATDNPHYLLPRLTQVALSPSQAFDDGVLLKMIESRWHPDQLHTVGSEGVAWLDHVAITGGFETLGKQCLVRLTQLRAEGLTIYFP